MENTLQAAMRQWERARNRIVKPLALKVSAKVPSDIDIAMAQTPKPIVELAEELGILASELESYGQYKAKVDLSIIDRLNYRKDGKYIVISG
jgi:methylenetetrahydrofolate dehydrogenase (NADP+)/methenyltetrahydrofolate cyclohydrolase/formyltetrahydrofolate synthetase